MHISPPASNCGGDVLPTSSLILILDGKSDWSVALGCRLNTALPRVMGGGVTVGVVSPDHRVRTSARRGGGKGGRANGTWNGTRETGR